jgi:hypothetical protein
MSVAMWYRESCQPYDALLECRPRRKELLNQITLILSRLGYLYRLYEPERVVETNIESGCRCATEEVGSRKFQAGLSRDDVNGATDGMMDNMTLISEFGG